MFAIAGQTRQAWNIRNFLEKRVSYQAYGKFCNLASLSICCVIPTSCASSHRVYRHFSVVDGGATATPLTRLWRRSSKKRYSERYTGKLPLTNHYLISYTRYGRNCRCNSSNCLDLPGLKVGRI